MELLQRPKRSLCRDEAHARQCNYATEILRKRFELFRFVALSDELAKIKVLGSQLGLS